MLKPLDVLRAYRRHDYSIADAFSSHLERVADKTFCVDGEQAWTWHQFAIQVRKAETVLASWGIAHGDRVAMVAFNHWAHLLLLLAVARRGAILVPINPAFGPDEAGYVLANADIAAVACDDARLEVVRTACASHGLRPKIVLLEGGNGEVPSLMDLVDRAAPCESTPSGTAADTCLIIYTSGTTGFPKGAMHSQRSFVLAGEAFVQRLYVQPEDRLMVVLPLFHMNALCYSVSGAIAAGATVIVLPRFSASTFWQSAVQHRATAVNLIDAACNILATRPRTEYDPAHGLQKVYGVRREAEQTFRDEFHIPHLISGYGMTEIPGVTCSPFEGEQRTGSMGVAARHPDPAVEWAHCRVVTDDGSDVPDGTVGELIVKTPIIMQGYFRDPHQTAAAFRDGWFLTGDLVRRDHDGYFYFVSRKNDIIRRRGENIAGAELDRVIAAHPGVQAVATIGVPSEVGEEDILVAVVPKPESRLTAQEIADWCAERLAPMKVPRYVAFLASLPYTPTQKVLKSALRADAGLKARAVDMQVRTPPR